MLIKNLVCVGVYGLLSGVVSAAPLAGKPASAPAQTVSSYEKAGLDEKTVAGLKEVDKAYQTQNDLTSQVIHNRLITKSRAGKIYHFHPYRNNGKAGLADVDKVDAQDLASLYEDLKNLHNKSLKQTLSSDDKKLLTSYRNRVIETYDEMNKMNARIMTKTDGITKRFGKWDPKTGKFANEDKLLSKVKSTASDATAHTAALADVSGLDAAKAYMVRIKPVNEALDEMYNIRYLAENRVGWFGRLFRSWGLNGSAKAERLATFKQYKANTQPATNAKAAPPKEADKASRSQSADKPSEPQAADNPTSDQSTLDEIGDNHGPVSDNSLEYLFNAAPSRAALEQEGLGNVAQVARDKELLASASQRGVDGAFNEAADKAAGQAADDSILSKLGDLVHF